MDVNQRLRAMVAAQPYPMLFATLSGAHLYGFPSPDSDYDLRGAHILPLAKVVGLEPADDTLTISQVADGLELDIVTHEVRKFFGLLLKPNGYVLEQLFSPLVVHGSPGHEELKAIARGCLTRWHYHHYAGFAENQWRLFHKENPRRVKPLLYVYRVLLTGLHLLRSGELEASLLHLNDIFRLPQVPALLQRKTAGPEHSQLPDADLDFHEAEFQRLQAELKDAFAATRLPAEVTAETKASLNQLLIRLRLA